MGKCSGLKGGGHHRRALDVAEKKKNEKAARKKEQAASGKRAVILKEILNEIDPDCDLYLDAVICDKGNHSQQLDQQSGSSSNTNTNTNSNTNCNTGNKRLPDLCRAHFRHEACGNKRCKFSHEHSIADALSNVVSGTNTNMDYHDYDYDYDDGPQTQTQTIPALRHLPGILENGPSQKKNKSRLRRPRQLQQPYVPSAFENAISEGTADRIAACLDSDQDVVSLGMTCWHLFGTILEGNGCPDVQKRKYRARERRLYRRNSMLLANKTLAGGLRYAVSYFESSSSLSSSSKKKKKSKTLNNKKQPQQASLRPVLVFDYENPNVYKAFRESKRRKASLETSLAKNCTITNSN